MKEKDKVPTMFGELNKLADKYVDALIALWNKGGEDDPSFDKVYGYWVGNDRTGVWCYADDFYLSFADLVYCVENGVSYEECRAWLDYCVEADSLGLDTINLRSWHLGAPRVPRESIDKLHKLRNDFQDYLTLVKDGQGKTEKVKFIVKEHDLARRLDDIACDFGDTFCKGEEVTINTPIADVTFKFK